MIHKMDYAACLSMFFLVRAIVAQDYRLRENEYFCGNKPADIVFLLDSSNSIWGPDFTTQMNFVRNVVSMFDIRKNTTRVGVATFSSRVHLEFHLNNFTSKNDVLNAISDIKQFRSAGYSTNTNKAIWFMRKRMFRKRYGSRPEVPKVGIILTDGQSTNMLMTAWEASKAKRENIHLFAIGIGARVNRRELKLIASRPTNEYYFKVDNYGALEFIKNILAVRTCRVTPKPTTTTTTTPAPTTTTTTPTTTTTSLMEVARRVCSNGVGDIVFAYDSSTSVSEADLRKQIEFSKEIIRNLNIAVNGTRVGALLYTDQIMEIIQLNENNDRDDLEGILDKVERSAGRNRLDLALKFIRTKSFRRGIARMNAAQVAIVFTSRPTMYVHNTKKQSKKARDSGISVIPISVGRVTEDEMRAISGSSDPRKYHRLSSPDELSSIIAEVSVAACRVPKPEVPIYDQSCGSRQEADIMFILDSVNAGRKNTKKVLAFIKDLVDDLDIDPKKIQVGLMSAECQDDNTGFQLNSNSGKEEVKNALTKVKGVDLSGMLKQMRRGAYSHRQGGRKEAKKYAILIVDGNLDEPIRALTEAQRARIHGIEVIVIQVGQDPTQEELLMMCDAPKKQHFFKVPSYKELPAMQDRLWQAICDEL